MSETQGRHQFGMDFSSVQSIPEDPKNRPEYFAAFKTLIREEREKVRAWHLEGAGGREVIQAITGLADQVIMQVVGSLAKLEKYADKNIIPQFALVAVGGYGRGEMNPCSDIDLLFLIPRKIDSIVDEFIQDVISSLWGIGLEIGQSCRTIKECEKLAAEDLTVKTNMIETRYLIGNQDLYKELWQSVRNNILKKNVNAFLKAKLEESLSRHGKGNGVASNPEPDIKDGPGGLRDYHSALWAVAARFGVLSFNEIGRDDVIAGKELKSLGQSVDFILRVRNELHYLQGKKTDVLTMDIQRPMAINLGYQGEDKSAQVEKFMGDYFLHATNLYRSCELIFNRCLEVKPIISKVISSLKKKDVGNGFSALDSELIPKKGEDFNFEENKNLFIEIFNFCKNHDLALGTNLRRQVRLNARLIDEEFIGSDEVKKFLSNLFDHPNSARTLRLMHETEVLGKLLPEFEEIHCQVNYDFYHRFTADEHSLRMVRFLEELSSVKDGDLKEMAEVYAALPSRGLVKLACLLHDLAPGQGAGGLLDDGESPFSVVNRRLGLTPEQADNLRFLVNNLHSMTEAAFHQDIQLSNTIQAFASQVQTPKKLDLLYVFSYAELRAVAPDTWTTWKKVQLSDLYHAVKNYLERPETLQEKPLVTRDKVYQILKDESSKDEIDQYLSSMPEDYLATVHPEEVALHLKMIHNLEQEQFALHYIYYKPGSFFNLTLCCRENPYLFKSLVGILTAKLMNILGAQIYSRNDGMVVIIVQVERTQSMNLLGKPDDEVWLEIESDLKEIMANPSALIALLKARPRMVTGKKSHAGIVPKVQIENHADSAFTFIRIEASDHPGMLYKIAKALTDYEIKIHRAKIACKGGQGIDGFYVTLHGKKILFESLLRRIKEKVINVLLVENLEDI